MLSPWRSAWAMTQQEDRHTWSGTTTCRRGLNLLPYLYVETRSPDQPINPFSAYVHNAPHQARRACARRDCSAPPRRPPSPECGC